MARIIIFGGAGMVALLLEPLLVARGDEVTAVVRNPEQIEEVEPIGATAHVADVEQLDTAALTELIRGHDAVVWSAGAGNGHPVRTRAVDRDAAIRTMDAAVRAGVSRYIMVSYFGSSPNHGVDPEHPFFNYAEAKSAADEYLRQSPLDWTILGPSGLTVGSASGRIDVHAQKSETVSRDNTAQVIVAALEDDATIGRTYRFNDGDVPIAEALRSPERNAEQSPSSESSQNA